MTWRFAPLACLLPLAASAANPTPSTFAGTFFGSLPAASCASQDVLLDLGADGRYALMLERGKNREMTAADITAELKAIHGQNDSATVLVNGERDASYQTLMQGIDLIKDAGITKVSLVSLPTDGK